ncbi:integrase [Gossypium australe]|uniref:Integrase n=1 Tax=Gossypium australe TaxID=47621 RepID=A0A5B6VA61_9ROSI|nr:integrase [Gossypium australe]
MPNDKDLRQSILWEAHASPYVMHPRANKMYRDPVKVENQLLSRLLQHIKISQWKWEQITIDFVRGLPLTPTN